MEKTERVSRRWLARRALVGALAAPAALEAQAPAASAEEQEAVRSLERSLEAVKNVSVAREVAPAMRFKA